MIPPELIRHREAIQRLCRQYHVRELLLFGSALCEDFDAESDYDLLVEFQPETPVGFITLGQLQQELSELLGREVDLVPKGGLKPLIRQEILADSEVLYAA